METSDGARPRSQQATSLWLVAVIRSLYQEMMKFDVEADGDNDGYEAWEIWERTQVDLLTFYNSDCGGDSLTVLDFRILWHVRSVRHQPEP